MDDSAGGQQGVSTQVPVDMGSPELQQTADAVTANPAAMLDLEPQHVVGTEDPGLSQQLTDPPLEADEGMCFGVLTSRTFHTVSQPFVLTAVPTGVPASDCHTVCSACVERESM